MQRLGGRSTFGSTWGKAGRPAGLGQSEHPLVQLDGCSKTRIHARPAPTGALRGPCPVPEVPHCLLHCTADTPRASAQAGPSPPNTCSVTSQKGPSDGHSEEAGPQVLSPIPVPFLFPSPWTPLALIVFVCSGITSPLPLSELPEASSAMFLAGSPVPGIVPGT